MKRLGARLIGDPERVAFEERMFNFSLIIAAFLTAVGAGMDLFYYGVSNYTNLVFFLFWLLCYHLSRVRGQFKKVSLPAIAALVFIFFPYNWVLSNGIFGVLPYYTIIFVTVLCIVLSGTRRRFMIFSLLAVEVLLSCRDAYLIGSFTEEITHTISVMDRLIHLSVILVATAVLLIGYSNAYKKEKMRSETYAQTISWHYNQQLYYMENLEAVISRLRSERHDFNNHLAVIYGLLETEERDRAEAYVSQLVKSAGEYRPVVHIPYPAARAMLNYKLSAAQEEGIELRLSVRVPERLSLDEFDLAVILGNLLDNAVEACRRLEDGKGYIALRISYQPAYLVIRVENPAGAASAPPADGKTAKADADNHGFGLRNIAYLAQKHHGFLKTSLENGVFRTDVALLAESVCPPCGSPGPVGR